MAFPGKLPIIIYWYLIRQPNWMQPCIKPQKLAILEYLSDKAVLHGCSFFPLPLWKWHRFTIFPSFLEHFHCWLYAKVVKQITATVNQCIHSLFRHSTWFHVCRHGATFYMMCFILLWTIAENIGFIFCRRYSENHRINKNQQKSKLFCFCWGILAWLVEFLCCFPRPITEIQLQKWWKKIEHDLFVWCKTHNFFPTSFIEFCACKFDCSVVHLSVVFIFAESNAFWI